MVENDYNGIKYIKRSQILIIIIISTPLLLLVYSLLGMIAMRGDFEFLLCFLYYKIEELPIEYDNVQTNEERKTIYDYGRIEN